MKKLVIVLLVLGLLLAVPAQAVDYVPTVLSNDIDGQADETEYAVPFTIINPYANVNWAAFGQYKAALHVHTNHSDGSATLADTVRHHYNLGFDILAITDHNVLFNRWDELPGRSPEHHAISWSRLWGTREALTTEEKEAIYAGTYTGPFPAPFPQLRRQQANGMISIPAANEQSRVSHINTFWAPFNNSLLDSMQSVLRTTTELGGLAIINHPGRYTGGRHGGERGEAASNDPANIARYRYLFLEFDVALGMEIFNRLDRETRSDRILWDNLLMELMPYNRPVWGFSNDDSHSLICVGYNWNALLMSELTADAARVAMETGAFYAVTRVARREGVNADQPDRASEDTLFLLDQSTPRITNITADGFYITITGENVDRIEWIADGRVIHTGSTLNLRDHYYRDIRHNYVRAQLVSETGIAMTQPFGIWTTYPGVRPVVITVDTLHWWVWLTFAGWALVFGGITFLIVRKIKRRKHA